MALTIPVENISARARQVDGRRAVLAVARTLWTALLALPYAAGWAARKTVRVLALMGAGLAMLGTAAAVGWRDAARPLHGDAEA